jgi:hypothetical protein
MSLIAIAALAMFAAAPAPDTPQADRAVRNYETVLTGQKQLGDLTPPERLELIQLEEWIRLHDNVPPPETKEQCKDRLASDTPSHLEDALLDLKCSQRPANASQ